MRKGIYGTFLRPLLFLLDPETAHDFAMRRLRTASENSVLLKTLRRFRPPPNPVTLFRLTFPNRIGLAAGFDKNGVALPAWEAMGFGFIEIGTVTAKAQPGNPKPRIFRLPKQEALINRLGFNNDGADMVANRLRHWYELGAWPKVPVGINLGKSKNTELEHATADYLHSFRRLQRYADYVVLNVSSPNTPGLRSLQESQSLASLVRAVQDENRSEKPLFVKVAPDLSDTAIDDVVEVCSDNQVAAIIATNTTIDHSTIPSQLEQAGGLSGAPLQKKSTAIITAIRSKCRLPVIGCGGIRDVDSALEKANAGASLIQLYTGLIYRGPGLLREIGEAFARRDWVNDDD